MKLSDNAYGCSGLSIYKLCIRRQFDSHLFFYCDSDRKENLFFWEKSYRKEEWRHHNHIQKLVVKENSKVSLARTDWLSISNSCNIILELHGIDSESNNNRQTDRQTKPVASVRAYQLSNVHCRVLCWLHNVSKHCWSESHWLRWSGYIQCTFNICHVKLCAFRICCFRFFLFFFCSVFHIFAIKTFTYFKLNSRSTFYTRQPAFNLGEKLIHYLRNAQ